MNILQQPTTANLIPSGIFALLAMITNNMTLVLASGYLLIPLLMLANNYKKVKKIDSLRLYSRQKLAKRNDSVTRYFSKQGNINYIDGLLNEFLAKNKPFLKQKYSLKQLAEDVNIPLHYLSAFINRYYKMNYNDFINRCRVRASEEMIRNGECRYKTLEAISSECGFNNRNTFSIAFKKETGKSPSAFLKEIKDQLNEAFLLIKIEKSTPQAVESSGC